MKTGSDALGIAENESWSAKHESRTDALVTAEKEYGSEIMKTRPDALITAENEYGSVKHENATRPPRYRGKVLSECKT
jgi:hypothetical protein